MTGERSRTEFRSDYNARWIDESFEIKVRNHKTEPVEVRIVEHLYRWTSWDIVKNSDPFKKSDAQTIEFLVQIPRDGEKTVNYKVHYSCSWEIGFAANPKRNSANTPVSARRSN